MRLGQNWLLQVAQTVVDAGASYINIPDSRFHRTPAEYGAKYLIDHKQDRPQTFIPLLPWWPRYGRMNSLAAVKNGAWSSEGTITGSANGQEMRTWRRVALQYPWRITSESPIVLNETINTSELASAILDLHLKNIWLSCGNASHESEYQDGVLKTSYLWNHHPELVGVKSTASQNCLAAMLLSKTAWAGTGIYRRRHQAIVC